MPGFYFSAARPAREDAVVLSAARCLDGFWLAVFVALADGEIASVEADSAVLPSAVVPIAAEMLSGTLGVSEASEAAVAATVVIGEAADSVVSATSETTTAGGAVAVARCADPCSRRFGAATGFAVSAVMASPATAGAVVATASDRILCTVAAERVTATSGTPGGRRTSPSLEGKLNHLPKFLMR